MIDFFLDRTVNFIWAFDGNGNIKEYPGNYTNYLEKKEQERRQQVPKQITTKTSKIKNNNVKTKLSFKEQYELNQLTALIPDLEKQKIDLELSLQNTDLSDYKTIEKISLEIEILSKKIDDSTLRWLELSDL